MTIIEEFTSLTGEPYLIVKRLRDVGFTDAQIESILVIVDTTCLHCYDGDNDCQCWNNE